MTITQTEMAAIDARIADAGSKLARAEGIKDMRERDVANATKRGFNIDARIADLAEADQAYREAKAEYKAQAAYYGGWSRFFLVVGGHIHRDMHCSTCNNGRERTTFGWLTDMSGRTEADCVAEHGALLCTVCFPSAPVEWTNKLELDAEAKRATMCDGSGLSPAKNAQPYANYQPCSVCGKHQRITSRGAVRAHKPPTK